MCVSPVACVWNTDTITACLYAFVLSVAKALDVVEPVTSKATVQYTKVHDSVVVSTVCDDMYSRGLVGTMNKWHHERDQDERRQHAVHTGAVTYTVVLCRGLWLFELAHVAHYLLHIAGITHAMVSMLS